MSPRPRTKGAHRGRPPTLRALVGLSAADCSALIIAVRLARNGYDGHVAPFPARLRRLTRGLEKTRTQILQLERMLARERRGGST